MEMQATNLPSSIKLVVSYEIGVIALERIENKRLIRLWNFALRESAFISQVHVGGESTGLKPRGFGIDLDVYSLGGLDAED